MKRSLRFCLFLAVFVLILLAASAALADRPTGGVRPVQMDQYAARRRSAYSVSTDKGTYEAGETITINVNFPEGGRYAISLCVYDDTYGPDSYTGDTVWSPDDQTDATITYDMIWNPGEYWVLVNFFDADGNEVNGNGFCSFTVTECSGTNSVNAMVQQAVSSCRGENDFETLVNL